MRRRTSHSRPWPVSMVGGEGIRRLNGRRVMQKGGCPEARRCSVPAPSLALTLGFSVSSAVRRWHHAAAEHRGYVAGHISIELPRVRRRDQRVRPVEFSGLDDWQCDLPGPGADLDSSLSLSPPSSASCTTRTGSPGLRAHWGSHRQRSHLHSGGDQ